MGAYFTKQMQSLMDMLQSTTPHFVRCVNPNQFKQARQFDAEYVRPQLRYGGLVEALRVLKLGFPRCATRAWVRPTPMCSCMRSRVPYTEIYERYGKGIEKQRGRPLNPQDFTEAVFLAFGCDPAGYQLGLTKVFFRPGKQEWLEEVLGKYPELTPEMSTKITRLMIGAPHAIAASHRPLSTRSLAHRQARQARPRRRPAARAPAPVGRPAQVLPPAHPRRRRHGRYVQGARKRVASCIADVAAAQFLAKPMQSLNRNRAALAMQGAIHTAAGAAAIGR